MLIVEESMPEPGVGENFVRRSTSNARGGSGGDVAAEHGAEARIARATAHAEPEQVKKNQTLNERVHKLKTWLLKRMWRKSDAAIDLHAEQEEAKKFFEEWGEDALEKILGKGNIQADLSQLREDVQIGILEIAQKEGWNHDKFIKLLPDKEQKKLVSDFLRTRESMQRIQEAVLQQADEGGKGSAQLHQQAETTLHQRGAPETAQERANFLRLPQNLAQPPADAATADIVRCYNSMVDRDDPARTIDPEDRVRVTSRDLTRAIQLLEDRLGSQSEAGLPQTVRNYIVLLQADLRRKAGALATTEHDQADYETARIIGRVKKRLDNGEIVPIKVKDVIVNRRIRNQVYNDLFAAVDSTPHEFWQQAWNPLTQGARYELFMEYIRSLSEAGLPELEQEVGKEYLVQYLKNRRMFFAGQNIPVDQINTVAVYDALPQNQRELLASALTRELREDHSQYQKERHARETLHNANALMYRSNIQPDQVFNYIKEFGGELGDMAHRFQGIRQMMNLYEEQVRLAMLRHGGYLRAEDVLGKTSTEVRQELGSDVQVRVRSEKSVIEKEAKKAFIDMYNRNMIYTHAENGDVVSMKTANGNKPIEDWEVERILTISRGMMLASQRLLSLAGESRLTGEARINQLFLQDILYASSYFIHLDAKYHVPGMKPTGALIFEPGIKKWGPGFDLWIQPHRLGPAYKAHKQWKDYPVEFLESHDLADLQRQNPNRAGDLFTWLSEWRLKEDVRGNETIIRDFMQRGQRKMLEIIVANNQMHNDYNALRQAARFAGITPDEFFVAHQDVTYENLVKAEKPYTEHDVAAINLYIYLHGGTGIDAANRADILQLNGRLNEYAKWVGTGLRFERMRGDLTYLDSFKDKKNQPKAKAAVPRAMELLSHIVDFQPDKIFLKSRKIQARVMPRIRELWQSGTYTKPDGTVITVTQNGIFSEERFQEILSSTMMDLSFMQDMVYKNRSYILEQDGTFDNITFLDRNGNVKFNLDLIYDAANNIVHDVAPPDPNLYPGGAQSVEYQNDLQKYNDLLQDRQQMRIHIEQQLQNGTVRQFIQLMQEDWDTHHGGIAETKRHDGAKEDNTPSYFEEFIKYREYYHGYVLWSGDAPLDEMHMTAVGPTGSFTMRAGNSLDNYKAAQAGNDLLGNLKNIQTPEQAIPFLGNIYKPIFNYDAGRAQEVLGEWAETLLKVYGADWQAVLPLWGGFRGWIGKSSFIQSWYGKRMAIWQAQEKRHLIDLMKEKGYLSDAKYSELKVLARARWWWEIPVDKLNYPLQLLLLAGTIYVLQKGLSDDDR